MQSGGCIHSDIFFSVDTLTCSQTAVSIVLSFLCGYIKVQSDDFIHSVVILLWMLSAVR